MGTSVSVCVYVIPSAPGRLPARRSARENIV